MNKKLVSRLRRVGDDFTVISQTNEAKVISLCDACGNSACKMHDTVTSVKNRGYGVIVATCQHYHAPLIFRDDKGLESVGSTCNTFRTGETWKARLKTGDTVALCSAKGETFGQAMVMGVHSGTQDEMLGQYAGENHMLKADKLGVAEAATALAAVLKKFYGHFMGRETPLTVIELKRTL